MSDKEFKVRTTLCDAGDTHKTAQEMEGKWLQAFLRRVGVPGVMLKKKLSDQIGNEQWRQYLFDKFQLEIVNNNSLKEVRVTKYIEGDRDGKTEVIAEWSKPEIVRINKVNQRPYCELHLKYWQLI